MGHRQRGTDVAEAGDELQASKLECKKARGSPSCAMILALAEKVESPPANVVQCS